MVKNIVPKLHELQSQLERGITQPSDRLLDYIPLYVMALLLGQARI